MCSGCSACSHRQHAHSSANNDTYRYVRSQTVGYLMNCNVFKQVRMSLPDIEHNCVNASDVAFILSCEQISFRRDTRRCVDVFGNTTTWAYSRSALTLGAYWSQ